MSSEYIGLVVGERSGRVYSVINSEDDADLDNPAHLAITVEPPKPGAEPESLRMVKWERNGLEAFVTFEDIAAITVDYYTRTHYRPDEPPPYGEDNIDYMA